ncbi:MAG: type I-E CRISPR-associated protein Cse1/CasA [Anaerolineaceae bacterium]|nr:type I-E CRISPR-associated protein Cse1/CasA [Brevefilum sp.]
MEISFNLLKQPWLPCSDEHDKLVTLNLLDLIAKAHTLKEIQGDLSIITGALYLFLIAFIKNILDIQNEDEWEALWNAGKFPLDTFLDYTNQWQSRFELFDTEHPFYQDPHIGQRERDAKKLAAGKSAEPKGISGLLMHLASGNNATLFDHSLDDMPGWFTPAEAAQLLITWQAFSLGGMSSASISKDKYYKDSPFARGILFLNKGQSLFQTLMLNLTPGDFYSLHGQGEDRPAWESTDAFLTERYDPAGMVDFLTWQSRRILLAPEKNDGETGVRSLFIAPGHGLLETFSNPFYHNRLQQKDGKQTIRPLRFQQGRSLWRDSAAILNVKSQNMETPLPIQWSANLQFHEILHTDSIQINLLGMCTQPGQKKVYFYAHESFSAPTVYLEDGDLRYQLEKGLEWAEQVRSDLYLAVRDLARYFVAPMHDLDTVRTPSRDDTDPLMQHWNTEHLYWGFLEPAFYDYIFSLPTYKTADESWQNAIRKAARNALSITTNQVGTAPAGLKARAKAESALNRLMYKTFNPEEKGVTDDR